MGTRVRPTAIVVALVFLLAVACGASDLGSQDARSTTDGSPEVTVSVFAAASLADSFGELEAVYEAAHTGIDVQLNLAGSSSLREQILEGAPADVYASANQANMTSIVEAGEAAGDPRVFARNRLQIAVPAGNPAGVSGLEDFADQDLFIGLCARGVPCGDFAREALANAGVTASVDTNEPDVRALLTKIGAGELDAGIVYVTDVLSAGDLVDGVDLSDADNVVAEYPIVSLLNSPNPSQAEAFVTFVLSAEGQSILAAFGFEPN